MDLEKREKKGFSIVLDSDLIAALRDEEVQRSIERIETHLDAAYREAFADGMSPNDIISWILFWASEQMVRAQFRG
jgi:hypothetical protein